MGFKRKNGKKNCKRQNGCCARLVHRCQNTYDFVKICDVITLVPSIFNKRKKTEPKRRKNENGKNLSHSMDSISHVLE